MMAALAERHVLLWRGINVGPHRRIPKEDLVRWAQEAGATEVRTFQASGNVQVTLPTGVSADVVAEEVAEAARRERDIDVPVLATTPGELQEALAVFEAQGWPEQEPKAVALTLLHEVPGADGTAALRSLPVGEDRLALEGRFLWIRYATDVRSSALTLARIEKALGVTGRARNLATVRALAEG